ncbi:MAG: Co2+/Mg2+ efflux protein ApaG [Parvibaculales bacterium]|jgi:ApaG protein
MVTATTRDISVTVETSYLEKQSDPDEQYFVWAYRITIANHSNQTVQLLSRHWKISDGQGRVQEVRGEGVIGEQPILEPGANYTYSSGTPLQTPSGFMHGSYQMQSDDGERFDVDIPAFSLDSPHDSPQLH